MAYASVPKIFKEKRCSQKFYDDTVALKTAALAL